MADDQGKGKIVPRKGLFVQEHDFLSSIPSWDTFFHSAGGFQPPVQKSVNRWIYRLRYGYPLLFPCYFSNKWNYGCPQFPGVPLKIAGAKPLQFSHNKKLMDVPNFQEFHWKLQGRSPCNFPTIWSLWFQQYCRKCFCWCPILQFCRICFCCCPIQQFWLAFLLVPNPAVFHRSEAPALHILTYEFDISVRSR